MPIKKLVVAATAVLIVGVFAFYAGAGCVSNTSNPTTSIPPNTVILAGTSFTPATLTVTKGTTVTFKNNDGSTTHTSTSDTGIWDTGDITGNSSKTVTFNTAGTFPYHCTYHVSMGMKGTIIVQ